MNKLLIITEIRDLGDIVKSFGIYNVVATIYEPAKMMECIYQYRPDVLLYCESGRDSSEALKNLRLSHPNMRIIYMPGNLNMEDENDKKMIAEFIDLGIFDICFSSSIRKSELREFLTVIHRYEDVAQYANQADDNFEIFENGAKNVVIFSSIKPGSGKSFISTNIAAAIAKFGKSKRNGERPKVAIIEGDLQSLSVGTLLQIEDPMRNLRAALLEISRVVNKNGELVGNPIEQREVEKKVLDCFVPYHKVANLYALVGSELSLRDLHEINASQYYYLVSILVKHFDVIIIDTNSSLEHITTGPVLELARACYYILDLDYNNIRNNIRYRKDLDDLCEGKVRYILNRDMTKDGQMKTTERLSYTAADLEANGFELDARIPMIDLSIMYNRVYDGTPLIFDDSPATLKARGELMKIAGSIVPLQEAEKKKHKGLFRRR